AHTLRFVQGAIYNLKATITLADNDSIVGAPAAINEDVLAGLLDSPVTLRQPASNNLARMLLIKGQNIVLENFTLDGNARAGGNSATVGIAYDDSPGGPDNRGRLRLKSMTVENCGSDNVQITSDASGNNQAIGAYILDSSISRSSGGNGIAITRTSDVKIWRTSFEDNNNYGIRIMDSPVHILDSDISNNAAGGIYSTLDPTAQSFIYMQGPSEIIGNSVTTTGVSSGLSENLNSSIIINGYNGRGCNQTSQSQIALNIIAVSGRPEDNTIDGIRIIDSGSARIFGNTLQSSNGRSGRFKYGVSVGTVNCKTENSDSVFGNGFFGAFGTAPYHFAATTDGLMNTIGMAPGEQRQRVASCTTAARANATCSTTVSWPAPLADANYTASCTLDEPSHPAFVTSTSSKAAASIVVTIENAPSSSRGASGTLNCIAIHD
ncbi:MAG: right-handed parallel beta-helix repeat-containing protein, partial [Candidatus Acidiferrales bacterium]